MCSFANADFNTGDTFGKGFIVQANGVNQTGGGRTLNFSSGTTVAIVNNAYEITASGGGGGTPGGLSPQLQYNNSGNFAGVPGSGADSNGNIGIGTTTPSYLLDVAGYIRTSAGGFVFPDSSLQDTAAIVAGSGSWVQFNNAGTFGADNGFVYAAGNVGIDTGGDAPAYRFQIGQIFSTPSDPIMCTASIVYTPSGNYPSGGYTHTYRVWGDNGTDSYGPYSYGYCETTPVTDDGVSGNYNIVVSGYANGSNNYKILIQDDYIPLNYDTGYFTNTDPITDDGNYNAGQNVTPNVGSPKAWIDLVGSASFGGDVIIGGNLSASNLNGIDINTIVTTSGANADINIGPYTLTANSFYDSNGLIVSTQWSNISNGIYYGNDVKIGDPSDLGESTLTTKSIGTITLNGTTTANATTTITGVGSTFLSQTHAGDFFMLGAFGSYIREVDSDTQLKVFLPLGDGTTQTMTCDKASFTALDNRGNVIATANSTLAVWAMLNGASIGTDLRLTGLFIFEDAGGSNLQFGTSVGTKIGTSTSQKFAFHGATPIAQEPNTTAIDTLLSDLGLRASGGNSPFASNVGINTATASSSLVVNGGIKQIGNTQDNTFNWNIGIGTTAPKNKLDVNGSVAIGTYAGTTNPINNTLTISGNVGIGTSNPTQNLVVGNNASTGQTVITVVGNVGINTTFASSRLVANGDIKVIGGYNQVGTTANILNGNLGIGSITPGNALDIQGTIRESSLTASRALSSNSTKDVVSSSVTDTELGYLSGVTSAIQTQLNTKGAGTVTSITAGTGLTGGAITTSGTINSNAVEHLSYQPGLLTAINSTIGVYYKASKTSTVDNLIGSAVTFSCIANPTITLYECGTSITCASTPTTIGTVTVTAAGTATVGTISNSAITAGDYVGWAMTAGTCASIDIAATAQIHSN